MPFQPTSSYRAASKLFPYSCIVPPCHLGELILMKWTAPSSMPTPFLSLNYICPLTTRENFNLALGIVLLSEKWLLQRGKLPACTPAMTAVLHVAFSIFSCVMQHTCSKSLVCRVSPPFYSASFSIRLHHFVCSLCSVRAADCASIVLRMTAST